MDTHGKCIDCGKEIPKNRVKYCCDECKNRMKSNNESIRKRMKSCDISTKNCKENCRKKCKEECRKKCKEKCKEKCEEKCENRWKGHDDISLRRLYKRDNGHCYICDRELLNPENHYEKNSDIAPQVDHVTPIAKCGKHLWSNVKLICKNCNSDKADKLLCDESLCDRLYEEN